jgi:hypothetical protein
VSTLVTVYYLAIKNVPSLLEAFPKFVPFAILATVVGVPLSVGVGWIHLKRSRLYSSETDITVEANPYNYKMAPGKEVVGWRLNLIQLIILRRLADTTGLLTDSEKAEIGDLENQMSALLKGGYVGKPRRSNKF